MGVTVDTAIRELLQRGLIDPGEIVDGNVEVVDRACRNQGLSVVRSGRPGYFIKQPGEGECQSERTLRAEAAFYRFCAEEPRARALQSVVPRLHRFFEDEAALVLELVERSTPLWQYYASAGAPEFPEDAGAALGKALGVLHGTFRDPELRGDRRLERLVHGPPWILTIHKPTPELLSVLNPARVRALTIIQREVEIMRALERLRREWAPTTLIHGDIKGDNILVLKEDGAPPEACLVDWEMAQVGDAAWDVGSLLRDFVTFWMMSAPFSADLSAEETLVKARYPLGSLHPAIRAFWRAYRATAELDEEAARALLRRAIDFCAARLVQSAYEVAQGAVVLSNHAVAMLQLARNILSDPAGASIHLFGIPAAWRTSRHEAPRA